MISNKQHLRVIEKMMTAHAESNEKLRKEYAEQIEKLEKRHDAEITKLGVKERMLLDRLFALVGIPSMYGTLNEVNEQSAKDAANTPPAAPGRASIQQAMTAEDQEFSSTASRLEEHIAFLEQHATE